MPDKRQHRGPHPQDEELFAPKYHAALRAAVCDMSWLFGRGYSENAVLKIVGDRYRLRERQRRAALRASCSEPQRLERAEHQIAVEELPAAGIEVDGLNLLILLESALSGGFLFLGRDGCLRDLASVHGTYRQVQETATSIEMVGLAFPALPIHWLLDRPVSNSGRLKQLILEIAAQRRWPWQVELDHNPDHVLIRSGEVVVTSDSMILDKGVRWCNLGRHLVEACVPGARIVDLG